LNSKGYFETSNPAWQVVLGWTEQEIVSMSIFELLHPDDVERTRVGFDPGAHLRIRPMPGELDRVASMLAADPQVISWDRVTGDDCFVAKAFVQNMAALAALIDSLLPYATTNTSIVVSTAVAPCLPNLS
jgi:Lrp/AsnC family leucine-responsive transcriptional regulator